MPGRPWRRAGGGRYQGRWFDSDLVLGTLALVSGRWGALPARQVLAAGDLNECRAWDQVEDGQWGADYFANVEAAGYVDVTWSAWGEEKPTCLAAGRALQLDHVFATPITAARITGPAVAPIVPEHVASGESSDHTTINFTLGPAKRRTMPGLPLFAQ